MHDDLARAGITLRMTGAFAVEDADGQDMAGLSRRGQAMLAYLSQQRDMRAERSLLADLLWSDRGEEQARASLRQELSALRRALPEGLVCANRQHVWLEPGRVSVAREPGEPLEGFDLASEGFEDWLREFRAAAESRAPVAHAEPPAGLFDRPAVLLFAFDALSGSAEDQMIASGISADLRTNLSYWRWFPVIGPDAIGWKTAKEADLRETAASVEAAYAVTGSLAHLGPKIRVSVSLTDAQSGRTVWSQTFDGTMDDIFDFQEETSRAIVARIEPELARAETVRITRARPDSVAPWQFLAMADEIDRKSGEGYGTPESNREQARLMAQALERAPDFAPALARLGRIRFRFALLGWGEDSDADFAEAIALSGRALELDPDDWEAHAYNGLARVFGTREYEPGLFHCSESVRLNPSAALARHALACALEWLGRCEEALEHMRLIFRLNASYPGRAAVLGQITTCEQILGRAEGALDAARQLHAIAPDYARGLQRCVSAFGYFGQAAEAERALERLRELQPDFDEAYVRRTYPYEQAENLEVFVEGFRRAGAFG